MVEEHFEISTSKMLRSALKLEKMYAPKLIYIWRKFWNSYVRNAQICTYTGENVGICISEIPKIALKLTHPG